MLFKAILAKTWSTPDPASLVYDSCYTVWDHPRNIARPGTGVTYSSSSVATGDRIAIFATRGFYCTEHDNPFFSATFDPNKWWQIDLKNEYHLEKILFYPPYENKYCKDLTFRFGKNANASSSDNEIIYTHPGPVPVDVILVVNVTSDSVGRYLNILSSSTTKNFGIAAIQVITKEDF